MVYYRKLGPLLVVEAWYYYEITHKHGVCG